LVKKSRIFFQL